MNKFLIDKNDIVEFTKSDYIAIIHQLLDGCDEQIIRRIWLYNGKQYVVVNGYAFDLHRDYGRSIHHTFEIHYMPGRIS